MIYFLDLTPFSLSPPPTPSPTPSPAPKVFLGKMCEKIHRKANNEATHWQTLLKFLQDQRHAAHLRPDGSHMEEHLGETHRLSARPQERVQPRSRRAVRYPSSSLLTPVHDLPAQALHLHGPQDPRHCGAQCGKLPSHERRSCAERIHVGRAEFVVEHALRRRRSTRKSYFIFERQDACEHGEFYFLFFFLGLSKLP